jgi:hypothetical protein
MKSARVIVFIVLVLLLGVNSSNVLAIKTIQSPQDFSGDKISDLAIGVPGEDVPDASPPYTQHAGAINVLQGRSGIGLTDSWDQYLHQETSNVAGNAEEYDRFGEALATGDFNCDGFADLAVGVPGQDVGGKNEAGAVHIFWGYYFGLAYQDPLDDLILTQTAIPSISNSEEGDSFGKALAAGDFDGDGCNDLAIGAPGEDFGTSIENAGIVHVVYGHSDGFNLTRSQDFYQANGQLPETREDYDNFGAALTSGYFGTNDYADLAIGVPGENFEGTSTKSNVGVVHVIYGTGTGLGSMNQLWYQGNSGINGSAEVGDEFGKALTTGNFDGQLGDDLAIGVPGQDVGSANHAGAVHILYSSAGSLLTTNNHIIDQNTIYIPSLDPQPHDDENFGSALAGGDFNGDSIDDLAIGIPRDHFGTMTVTQCGAVNVIYGTESGLSSTDDEEWSQNDSNLLDTCEDGDEFGSALAVGNFDDDRYMDLAIGVPGEDSNRGAVHILYGDSFGLRDDNDQVWTQDSSGINGAAEGGDKFGSALASYPIMKTFIYLPLVFK